MISLHYSLYNDYIDIVQYSISHGANIERNTDQGYIPLDI